MVPYVRSEGGYWLTKKGKLDGGRGVFMAISCYDGMCILKHSPHPKESKPRQERTTHLLIIYSL